METYILTVRQPWATALIYWGKDVEGRTWKPPGTPVRVLIHAALRFDHDGLSWVNRHRGTALGSPFTDNSPDWHLGRVLGYVTVTGWTTESTSMWASRGQYNWLCADPVPAYAPFLVQGRAKLTRPPADWRDHFPEVA